jgi:hypothetical protein
MLRILCLIKNFLINIITAVIPCSRIRRRTKEKLRNFKLKNLFINKTKYDFVFSMGEACFVATVLTNIHIRKASGPFDWMSMSTFKKRFEIFINKFDKYFEEQDLEYIGIDKNNNRSVFLTKYTDISYNHDFTRKELFHEEYKVVREKYERRISRLFNYINKGKKILVVYVERRNSETTDKNTIIKLLNKANEVYDNKIDLLYVKSNKQIKIGDSKIKRIDNHLRIAEYTGESRNAGISIKERQLIDNSLKDILVFVRI